MRQIRPFNTFFRYTVVGFDLNATKIDRTKAQRFFAEYGKAVHAENTCGAMTAHGPNTHGWLVATSDPFGLMAALDAAGFREGVRDARVMYHGLLQEYFSNVVATPDAEERIRVANLRVHEWRIQHDTAYAAEQIMREED